jgi:hypothetical protein
VSVFFGGVCGPLVLGSGAGGGASWSPPRLSAPGRRPWSTALPALEDAAPPLAPSPPLPPGHPLPRSRAPASRCSHLDGSYTIFGEVVTGLDVVRAVNALAKGRPDNTATADAGAFIIDSGQIRRGAPVTQAALDSRRRA